MNADIYRLSLRQLIVGRRALALGLIPLIVGLVAVAHAIRRGDADAATFYSRLFEQTFIPDGLAFVTLVLGASAIGDERDDGTILYLSATPLRRSAIVVAKLAAAWTAALLVCLPGFVLCLVFGLGSTLAVRSALLSVAALVLTTLGYACAAGWLSLQARRPVVIGFLYILFWEGSIATWAPSARWLSIGGYGKALVAAGLPGTPSRGPDVSALVATLVGLAIALVAAWAATRRISRVELP